MNVTTFPPGGCSIAHKHRDFETALYGIHGEVVLFYGERLEHEVVVGRGDFCFIAPDVPHKAYNLSDAETALFVSARNDAAEQENVVATPEAEDETLAERVAERAAASPPRRARRRRRRPRAPVPGCARPTDACRRGHRRGDASGAARRAAARSTGGRSTRFSRRSPTSSSPA